MKLPVAALLSGLVACTAEPRRPAAEPDRASAEISPELEAALAAVREEESTRPRSETLSGPRPEERWQPRTLEAHERPLPPLGRRALVDVQLADAELEEALRLLAEAGGFAFVAEGQLAGRVNVRMRRVRPYEALVTIAEAHGAAVARRGNIVVVTPRSGP